MTLANQFMQGANFVRQTKRDARQDQLIEQQSQRAQERHDATLASASLRDTVAQEQHDEWKRGAGQRATLADLQLSEAQAQATRNAEAHAQQTKLLEQNNARQQVIQGREDKLWEQSQKDRARQENLQWLQANSQIEMHNLATNGHMSLEFYNRSKGTPFDIGKLVDPEYTQQLDFLAATLDPRDGRVNPRDPRFLHTFNTVFADDINKGLEASAHPQTGSPAVSKRVVNAYPVADRPGEFYAEVEVTYEDGTTRHEPMTRGRSNAANAELSTVSVGDLVQQVSARQAFRGLVERTGLAEKYRAFDAAQRAPAQQAQLQDQYKLLPEVYREGDREMGTAPYVTLNDYLWTQGDPQKVAVLQEVAQHNIQVDTHNSQVDDPAQRMQRVDFREAWAQLQNTQTPSQDANSALLDSITAEMPQDAVQPHGTANEPVVDDTAPRPTRRVRDGRGARRVTAPPRPEPSPPPPIRTSQRYRNRQRQLQQQRQQRQQQQ